MSGSILGPLSKSREMQELCAQKGVAEVIPFDAVNAAYPKVLAGKVCYRYVIDVAGSQIS